MSDGLINKQRGFTLVMTIFMVVVLSLLGSYMVRLNKVQLATEVYALQNARAYQAAKAGLGWASATLMVQTSNDQGCNNINMTSTNPLILPAMAGFTMTLTCTQFPNKLYQENQGAYYIYLIQSRSEWGAYNSEDYVSRQLEKTVITYALLP